MAEIRRLDYHVHEKHSEDAKQASIKDMVKAAERVGVVELSFTTHYVPCGPSKGFGVGPENMSEYIDEIYDAKEETNVSLNVGLEVDYFPEDERHVSEVLDEYPFDFVLGSVHVVNGIDIASGRNIGAFYDGGNVPEAAASYFRVWRRAIQSGLFDVMAHPDYFKKHLQLIRPEPLRWAELEPEVYDSIEALKEYGVGFEVNTSCLRHGAGEFFPMREFIETAHSMGVRKVTVGSDSHTPETVGYRIEEALGALAQAGYSKVSSFRGRRESSIAISDLLSQQSSSDEQLVQEDQSSFRCPS
jgi:histidinol-phosphatase (PHP family)